MDDITHGRPVWAILRANEYLKPSDPLRLALVKKAREAPPSGPHAGLRHLVLEQGMTLRKLGPSAARSARSEFAGPRVRTRFIPACRTMDRRRCLRLQLTSRPARRISDKLPMTLL